LLRHPLNFNGKAILADGLLALRMDARSRSSRCAEG
jgi:hypothetical protein